MLRQWDCLEKIYGRPDEFQNEASRIGHVMLDYCISHNALQSFSYPTRISENKNIIVTNSEFFAMYDFSTSKEGSQVPQNNINVFLNT